MPKYRSTGLSLPRRTLDYLQRGAAEGMRNAELFDATCQFRDAGHPLEDVEGQLLARAMADGLNEAEARHAIRSAYARTSREPLGAATDAARFNHPSTTAGARGCQARAIRDGIADDH